MRLKEFLELYVQDDTYLEVTCIQSADIFWNGTCAEFKALSDEDDSDVDIGWLWLSNIYAEDATLIIEVSY